MTKIRLYADTSIFGGVFDTEFEKASNLLFEQIQADRFTLVTSAVVQTELEFAPESVVQFFNEMLERAEIVDITEEALTLRDAYLNAEIVSQKYTNDALHVALAVVSGCTLIVSWNFKHIVHFQKIPLYNAVNVLQGFKPVNIFSPLEVINYEDE